jgi:hypothetical protein
VSNPDPLKTDASRSARALLRVCPGCGAEFQTTRPNQVSCRPSCRAHASRQKKVTRYLELRAGLDAMLGSPATSRGNHAFDKPIKGQTEGTEAGRRRRNR